MNKLLVILLLLGETAGRELTSPDPVIYLDLNSAVDGDGSVASPYALLNSALAVAVTYTSSTLSISHTLHSQSYSLASNLTVIGNGVTFKPQGTFTVLSGCSLTLVDLKLSSGATSPSPLLRSRGCWHFARLQCRHYRIWL